MAKERISASFIVLLVVLFMLPSMGWACTVADSTNPGCTGDDSTISSLMPCVKSGDILTVTGACSDNITISQAGVTLDGTSATITAADPTKPVVTVIGAYATIKGFTISAGLVGVLAVEGAHINLLNNVISGNTKGGIIVRENSSAHIGFKSYYDTSASPNTIDSNLGPGIAVNSTSSAKIIGNTITNNTGDGINVNKFSQADIAGNVIDNNSENGVEVSGNSVVNLADNGTGAIYSQINSTDGNAQNKGVGISCLSGGNLGGYLGLLSGAKGSSSIASSCVYSMAGSLNSLMLVGTWKMTSCSSDTNPDLCPEQGTTLVIAISSKGTGTFKEGKITTKFTWGITGLEMTIIEKNNTMYGPIIFTNNNLFSWTFAEVGQPGTATITFQHK